MATLQHITTSSAAAAARVRADARVGKGSKGAPAPAKKQQLKEPPAPSARTGTKRVSGALPVAPNERAREFAKVIFEARKLWEARANDLADLAWAVNGGTIITPNFEATRTAEIFADYDKKLRRLIGKLDRQDQQRLASWLNNTTGDNLDEIHFRLGVARSFQSVCRGSVAKEIQSLDRIRAFIVLKNQAAMPSDE